MPQGHQVTKNEDYTNRGAITLSCLRAFVAIFICTHLKIKKGAAISGKHPFFERADCCEIYFSKVILFVAVKLEVFSM